MGDCDERTIKQLKELITVISDDDVRSLADNLMANLVKYPDDIAVLTGSVKALEVLPFMPRAKNEFIITLLLSLFKAPVNKKDALQRKTLKTEVIRFLLFFVKEDDQYAKLMMPELIAAMDDTHAGISSSVYHTLQRLAVEKPEYFERYSAALIKQLGSINKSTRAESAKLIGIIARSHPEYVCKAMPFLQSLSSFYPDANVKRNASEAYQIIWRSRKAEPAPVVKAPNVVSREGKGFADIVKLNVNAPNGPGADAQFSDEELKDIIDLTRKEFKSDAEAILNSLGVGHLTIKGTESPPKQKAPQPKPEVPEPVKVNKPSPPEKPVKVDKPEPALRMSAPVKQEPAPVKREPAPVKQESVPVKREPAPIKREPAKPPQPKVQMPKCPKCGGSTWAVGQLCDTCAGAEFDRIAAREH
jgi:hypothetical protein